MVMDLILSILIIVLSIAVFFYSGQYNTQMYLYEMIGGGVFPRICAVIMFVCGTEIIVEYILKKKRVSATGKPETITKGNSIRVAKMILSITLYVLFMEKLGYCVSTLLLSIVLVWLQDIRDWKKIAALSVGATVVLYVVFAVLLKVRLPKGILI